MNDIATVETERREVGYHLRVPFPVEVRCASDLRGGTRRYLAHNLSRGGLFLTTMLPLDPGTLLTCSFGLPDGQPPVTVLARVAWVRGASVLRETPAGMGVRFLDLGQADLRRIERMVTG
jgi:uncharacterized protein (TIGR02266 family)